MDRHGPSWSSKRIATNDHGSGRSASAWRCAWKRQAASHGGGGVVVGVGGGGCGGCGSCGGCGDGGGCGGCGCVGAGIPHGTGPAASAGRRRSNCARTCRAQPCGPSPPPFMWRRTAWSIQSQNRAATAPGSSLQQMETVASWVRPPRSAVCAPSSPSLPVVVTTATLKDTSGAVHALGVRASARRHHREGSSRSSRMRTVLGPRFVGLAGAMLAASQLPPQRTRLRARVVHGRELCEAEAGYGMWQQIRSKV